MFDFIKKTGVKKAKNSVSIALRHKDVEGMSASPIQIMKFTEIQMPREDVCRQRLKEDGIETSIVGISSVNSISRLRDSSSGSFRSDKVQ